MECVTARALMAVRRQFGALLLAAPRSMLLTGLTRDGTFLIENGAITRPVNCVPMNESWRKRSPTASSPRAWRTDIRAQVPVPHVQRSIQPPGLADAFHHGLVGPAHLARQHQQITRARLAGDGALADRDEGLRTRLRGQIGGVDHRRATQVQLCLAADESRRLQTTCHVGTARGTGLLCLRRHQESSGTP